MFDARQLLDALVGAPKSTGQQPGSGGLLDRVLEALNQAGQPGGPGGKVGQVLGQATAGVREAAQHANQATGGAAATRIGQVTDQVTGGQSAGELADKARGFMDRNPGVAEAALLSAAGLLLGTRQGRGVAGGVAGLGGLALIGGLAYKAFQNHQAGRPLLNTGEGAAAGSLPRASVPPTASLPSPAAFEPSSASDDDAMLYLRTMVAAASADGHIDEGERARITSGLSQAGIDAEAARWLERELADPASVDEIADRVGTPEKAAQVYAAARVAIDPDTMQEREFLRRLREALDVEPGIAAQIDDTATSIKMAV